MKKTATAFQAVNGIHNLIIRNNINSGIFIEFMIETKILNSEKEETKELLREFLEKENVHDEYIQKFDF